MGCNCKTVESILAIVILIVAIMPDLLGNTGSMWITIIAAALLLLHALMCKKCNAKLAIVPAPKKKKK
jgi:hypothetical protein